MTIADRLQILGIALLCFGIAGLMARKRGLFRWPESSLAETDLLSWRDIAGAFAIFFGVKILLAPMLSVILVYIFLWQGAQEVIEKSVAFHGWSNIFAILMTIVFLVAFTSSLEKRKWDRFWKVELPFWKNLAKQLLLGMSSWFVIYPLAVAVGQVADIAVLFFYQEANVEIEQLAVKYLRSTFSYPILFAVTTFVIVFVVPIVEELLFRGFLQTWLLKFFGRATAIAMTSLTFAIFHYSPTQKLSNVEVLSSLFVLSCFLGFLYERQRSLWAPIGLHAAFNGISVLLIFVIAA